MTANTTEEPNTSHHIQQNLCTNRPLYRQGKKLTAVKVYTVTSESQHLYIYGVPKINLRNELKSLCTKYGQLNTIHAVEGVETEAFTECYHVSYQRIQSARIAKKLLDNKSFYGGVLHVCYTPEHESIQELKYKLEQRNYDVLKRLHGEDIPRPNFKEVTQSLNGTGSSKEVNRKRKRPAVEITEERMVGVDPMVAWMNVPKELDPRIKTDESSNALPNKHYKLDTESTNENEIKKVTIAIKTRQVYGPQLPTNIILNQGDDFDDTSEKNESCKTFTDGNRVLVPTQVVLSKEFIHQEKKTRKQNKIVFRKKALKD